MSCYDLTTPLNFLIQNMYYVCMYNYECYDFTRSLSRGVFCIRILTFELFEVHIKMEVYNHKLLSDVGIIFCLKEGRGRELYGGSFICMS